ncbi:MAG: right-handed parallel beta-helix repeat-containing protein [Bryobacteraceae bacterium]|nr:right-handed parallel beta-helix repeat-containing protein [Bryobacteraceae bacterium]
MWVVAGDNTVIENIEFSGAKVPDRNGAGIRIDKGNVVVRNCVFHHNENGILGGAYGRILIEHSEFYDNGYGDGQSHNIYITSGAAEFTLRYSASRRARVGRLVKSRAAVNYILYNRLTQEDGSGSYEIDLPNGGLGYVIGNVLQQGDTTQNRGMLSYGFEGLQTSVPNQLFVVNNTFVSTRAAGATFIQAAAGVPLPPVVRNNIFSGNGSFTLPATAQMAGNVNSGDMGFLNPAQYDYRISHLSAALNAGVDPGTGAGFALRPVMQYLHPLCAVPRYDVGPMDAGAFEYGVIEASPVCAGPPQPPPPSPAPELSALTASSAKVASGGPVALTVALSAPAPSGGTAVSLSSSAPGLIAVPQSIVVPAGSQTATLPLAAGLAAAETRVLISASLGRNTSQTTVTVAPASGQPVLANLAGVVRSPLQVRPGADFTLSVQLQQAAPPAGVLVRLRAFSAAVKLPSSVVIPAGASSAKVAGTVDASAPAGSVAIEVASANSINVSLPIRAVR